MRTITFSLLAIIMATSSIAQGTTAASKSSPEDRAKVRTAKMTEELGLDPQRADAVYSINLRFVAAIDELKATELGEAEKKTRVTEIKDKRNAELKVVLTESQFARLREWRGEKKEKGHDVKHEMEEKQEKRPHNE